MQSPRRLLERNASLSSLQIEEAAHDPIAGRFVLSTMAAATANLRVAAKLRQNHKIHLRGE